MKLFFLRHGEAGVAATDDLRALTPRGEHEAREVAAAQRALLSSVKQVLVSPILRAQQTAEIACVAAGVSVPRHTVSWLVHETPVSIALREIAHLDQDTLLVGHQPLAGSVVNRLTGEHVPIGTGNLVVMEAEACLPDLMQLMGHYRP